MRQALRCQFDSQCPEGKCNHFTHTCVINDMDKYNDEVIKCLQATAPTFLMGQLIPNFFSMNDTQQFNAIKTKWTHTSCQPLHNWNPTYYDAFRMGLICAGNYIFIAVAHSFFLDLCGDPATRSFPISFVPQPIFLSEACKRSACAFEYKFSPYQSVICEEDVCNKVDSTTKTNLGVEACNVCIIPLRFCSNVTPRLLPPSVVLAKVQLIAVSL